MSIDLLLGRAPVARIVRVGYPPFEHDDPIEIHFADGAIVHIDIGPIGATDIVIGEGPLMDSAYGHLRTEEPDTFAAIARDWSSADMDLPWLIGAVLSAPRRLVMTDPYRIEVGYALDAGARTLVLFGEADSIFAAALDDPAIEPFGLVTL